MLQIVNATPFTAARCVLLSPKAEHIWVVALKGTFSVGADGKLELAQRQEAVTEAPSFVGEAGASTLLREPELVMEHPGTAITLYGCASSPDGRPCMQLDIGLSVGPMKRRLRVFGDRFWQRSLAGLAPSRPRPFVSMPLIYERAYGGVDAGSGATYRRNPIGRGYYLERKSALGQPLPNLEDPGSLLRNWRDEGDPACFAALASAWSPRLECAGTADERWQRERAPLWPLDFRPDYFNAAPPQQRVPSRLRGGERVCLENLGGAARLEFELPRVIFDMRARLRDGQLAMPVELDRVIIEADRREVMMVWRGALNCGPNARRVVATYIDTKLNLRTGKRDGST